MLVIGKSKAALQQAMVTHFLDGLNPDDIDGEAKAQIEKKASDLGEVIADWVQGLRVSVVIGPTAAGLQTTTQPGAPTAPPVAPITIFGELEVNP